MPTLTLFPNPYAVLDHKGRLAGIAPELEPLRKGNVPPLNRKIGASIAMVDGSYRPDSPDGFLPGKGDVFYVFSDDPVSVVCEDGQVDDYRKMVLRGEVFDASQDVPLEALAHARLKAIAEHVAAYGKAPDTSSWKVQFPGEDDVAEVCEALAKKLAQDAEAKAKAAKADADKAAADAAAKAEKRKAEKAELKRRLTIPDLVPAKHAAKSPQKD